jgi:hypothetical protein
MSTTNMAGGEALNREFWATRSARGHEGAVRESRIVFAKDRLGLDEFLQTGATRRSKEGP